MDNKPISELMQQFPRSGELVWIGLRPARGVTMVSVDSVIADTSSGLIGDRYNGNSGKRQVTLIQWEHLAALSAFSEKNVTAELLRRNLVIKGINLLALKNRKFTIGNAQFIVTGYCHPCSKMEIILGTGGYNAMRGHGGLTAQVLVTGSISVGDRLSVLPDEDCHD